jgi:hypothetical protein
MGSATPVPEGGDATATALPVAFSTFLNLAGTALLQRLALLALSPSLALGVLLDALLLPVWDTESSGPTLSSTAGLSSGGTDRMASM